MDPQGTTSGPKPPMDPSHSLMAPLQLEEPPWTPTEAPKDPLQPLQTSPTMPAPTQIPQPRPGPYLRLHSQMESAALEGQHGAVVVAGALREHPHPHLEGRWGGGRSQIRPIDPPSISHPLGNPYHTSAPHGPLPP